MATSSSMISRSSSTSTLSTTSLAAQANFLDPAVYEMKRRSAQLMADPKARELSNFVGSRAHESRLRESAGLSEEPSAVKVLPDAQAGDDKRNDPVVSCKARLEWREEMDRAIRRLMQDADMMLDDRLQDKTKHHMRCQHLDKTYAWFESHGKKEASKERAAPPYIRYDLGDPVMAGSLRKVTMPKGWTPGSRPSTSGGKTSLGAPSIMAAAAHSLSQTSTASTPTAASAPAASPVAALNFESLSAQAAGPSPPSGASPSASASKDSPTRRNSSASPSKRQAGRRVNPNKWNLPGGSS